MTDLASPFHAPAGPRWLAETFETEPRGFRTPAWVGVVQRLTSGLTEGLGPTRLQRYFRYGARVRQLPSTREVAPRVWLLAMKLRVDGWLARGCQPSLTVRELAAPGHAPERHVRALVGCRIVDGDGTLRRRSEVIVDLELSPAAKILALSTDGALLPRCDARR